MIDYSSVLYSPVYATLAVDVLLTVPDATAAVTIQAIDKTNGINIEGTMGENSPIVEMIRPAVVFRSLDLADLLIDVAEMDGGIVEMNGRTWRIESHRYWPSPGGQDDGQVLCVLIEGA